MELIIDDLIHTMLPLEAPVPKDPWLRAKFVQPGTMEAWYPIKFDGKNTFWGVIDRNERACDFFYLSVLERESPGWLMADVERDMRFRPRRLSDLPPRTEPDPLWDRGTVRIEVAGRQDGGKDIQLIELGWASEHGGFVRFPVEVCDEVLSRIGAVRDYLRRCDWPPVTDEVVWARQYGEDANDIFSVHGRRRPGRLRRFLLQRLLGVEPEQPLRGLTSCPCGDDNVPF